MRISKQLHSEAVKAGWEGTKKCFFAPRQLTSVLEASYAPPYNWLSNVVLQFTMKGWFELFGVDDAPDFHMASLETLGYLLLAIPSLTHLRMWLRSPDDGYDFSPWGHSHDVYSIAPYIRCQRTMVDWIMAFAWPFIEHLPRVTIGGAVKDSNQKWNSLLAHTKNVKAAMFDQLAE